MGRHLRYIPPSETGRRCVELTARTAQGAFLFKPTRRLRERFFGVIGRAQRLTGIHIHLFTYMTNHMHFLVSVRDAFELADFMRRVQAQTTVELRFQAKWSGPAWGGRYKLMVLSHEVKLLLRRVRYVLEQGCKEGLVWGPLDWPGPSAIHALCVGEWTIPGIWIDRTAQSRGRRCKSRRCSSKRLDPDTEFAQNETIHLTRLPGFEGLSDTDYFELFRRLVDEIESETRQEHRARGTRPMGLAKVRKVRPLLVARPVTLGPRPLVLASSKADREELLAVIRDAVERHRKATERLLAGDPRPDFPRGTFPRAGPFVTGKLLNGVV